MTTTDPRWLLMIELLFCMGHHPFSTLYCSSTVSRP
jgi:hypothetical protein